MAMGMFCVLLIATILSDEEKAIAYPLLFIGFVLAAHFGLIDTGGIAQ